MGSGRSARRKRSRQWSNAAISCGGPWPRSGGADPAPGAQEGGNGQTPCSRGGTAQPGDDGEATQRAGRDGEACNYLPPGGGAALHLARARAGGCKEGEEGEEKREEEVIACALLR